MKQKSFVYNFLLAPQCKLWRRLTLILFLGIISVNQALVGYKDFMPLMGAKIYWIVGGTILIYIITVYLILKIILKFLFAKHYLLFTVVIILYSLSYLTIPNIVYFQYVDGYDLLSENVIVDNLSSFVIYLLCISGVIVPVFLRNWIISNQYLTQLKVRQEISQIDQLKEQLNPSSFFKVLSKSQSLVKSEPNRASAMLMKLAQLLRYQLYDCNQAKVLLTAEVAFLRNFLELETLYTTSFNHKLTLTENVNGIFISPSILLPYVQCIINSFINEKEHHTLDIQIGGLKEFICVLLKIEGLVSLEKMKAELAIVGRRLDVLCKSNYQLSIEDSHIKGYTTITLQLSIQ